MRTIGNETIKTYLLGNLEEPSKTQLEERLLNDAELFEEVLVVEDELVDQYIAGRLSSDDKARFEAHFVVTPDRVRKIQFGRAFYKYLEQNDTAETPGAVQVKPSRSQFSFWQVRRPLIAFSLVAVAGFAILAVYWATLHKESSGSRRTHVITLAAGVTRSSGAGFHRETIPTDASTIELRLVVAEIRYRTYKADIQSETTRITDLMSSRTREENGEKTVVFSVATGSLPPDDYQVKLSGTDDAGQTEFIDSYAFGIAKR
ncbi:MAG TPA: hypothetical protein VLA93_05960 [Pyrinomonadaceae bacterium]|nr:hypothetical protein [Pyrinomonadaceae bacterium]